ncbi:MAG: enoyl-CoA hydratase [Pseudolabrys sp.]|nr:enoyl-CoA hydratase [Pseudolabrys sp.]MBV9955373.1 enoyl-CoA hydratase [Pseudolabrys sp.]
MTIKPQSDAVSSPELLRGDIDGVALLSLNRPARRNTLTEAMLAALHAEFDAMAQDKSVRAVVLSHNGPAFSSGHDMKEMQAHRTGPDRGRAYFKDLMERCAALMMKVQQIPQPVIAAVEGVAAAAGCQLVATCDLAIASETARFSTPGVHIGLFCSTPMVALSRNVANKHAMEMLLLGDAVSADEAYRIGLVNRVVPAGKASEEASSLARKIAGQSTLIVKHGKQAFYRQREMPLADAYKLTVEVMVENMMARDNEEGFKAFIEKRDPNWEDR